MTDREKVIKGLEYCTTAETSDDCKRCPYDGQCGIDPCALERDALELLTKHGRWLVLKNCANAGVYCSECKIKAFDHYPMNKRLSCFCPHCGAKMEAKRDD